MKQFAHFMVAGGVAAAANIVTRMLFSQFVRFEMAVVLAFCVGVAVAFALNRRFVFRESQGPPIRAFRRFVGVNLVALVQVYGVSVFLARVLFPGVGFAFYPDTTAHVLGVLSPVLTSYVLHKNYTFAG